MRQEESFLRQALPYTVFLGSIKKAITGFSIDSRTLHDGLFFVAIKGENFDGHDFIKSAVEKGASGLIINESQKGCLIEIDVEKLSNILVILVPDTFKALCDLAKAWREKFDIPIVGITGSVGKTTTKQMLGHILNCADINCLISFKNQNTLIGLALNILKLTDLHQVAAFELGISQFGEMESKVDILRPTIAVVTYISSAHVEGLKSLQNIAMEKFKIFKFLKSYEIAIACGDQKFLNKSFNHPVVKFGNKRINHIQARSIKFCSTEPDVTQVSFNLKLYDQKRKVVLKMGHLGFVNNALAAATTAHFLKIDFEKIIQGLESYNGFENRFEKQNLKNEKGFLINDCYNASPQSMKEAILAFDKLQAKTEKVAVLGDMLELGEKQLYWHRYIGRILAKSSSINRVILVGKRSKVIAALLPFAMKASCVESWQEAEKQFCAIIEEGPVLALVKASRGIQLDNLVKKVT